MASRWLATPYADCLQMPQNAGPSARTSLRLRQDESRLYFEVRDFGRSFELFEVEGGGLANMRDRLGAAGGTLVIESQLGGGTVVRGEVPCHSHVEPEGAARRAKSSPA